MTLPNQQLNFCLKMMQVAQQQRDLLNDIESLKAQWNLNNWLTTMADVDLAAQTATAHLTKSNLGNAINAFGAVQTALGDDVAGQLTNLIKLQG